MRHADPHDAFKAADADELIARAEAKDAGTLREHVRILRAALTLFCQRRERGQIHSVTTYNQFKDLLERTK